MFAQFQISLNLVANNKMHDSFSALKNLVVLIIEWDIACCNLLLQSIWYPTDVKHFNYSTCKLVDFFVERQ